MTKRKSSAGSKPRVPLTGARLMSLKLLQEMEQHNFSGEDAVYVRHEALASLTRSHSALAQLAAESAGQAQQIAELAYVIENYAMRLKVLSHIVKIAGERLENAIKERRDGVTILERVWSHSDTRVQ